MKTIYIIKYFCLIVLFGFSLTAHADYSTVDGEITAYIESQIQLDENLSDTDISITTTNGIVQLEGEVSSLQEKNAIIEIVQETSGVRKIDSSQLVVNPY